MTDVERIFLEQVVSDCTQVGEVDTAGRLTRLLALMNEPRYTVKDGVAVDDRVRYYSMDTCPFGVEVQLHTIGGVNMKGIVHPQNLYAYQGWRPLPRKFKE